MTDILGVDIGGTKVALRLETAGGEAHEVSRTWPDRGGVSADLAMLAELVREVVRRSGLAPRAVGVSVPGLTDAAGVVTTWPGRPSWVGLSLGDALEDVCGRSVSWADDGDLAALAEARRGGYRDMLYLGVGTGLGGGIVTEGRALPRAGRGSCEVGHVVIRDGGERCDCGRSGCAQAYACGPAILRRASAMSGQALTPVELRAGWQRGEGWATAAVGDAADALAVLAHTVHELVVLDHVVIGGGFAYAYDGFVDEVARLVAARERTGRAAPRVRAAADAGSSSLSGAVLLARESLG